MPPHDDELVVDEFEEQGDLLAGMLAAAVMDCRYRAAANRQSIKGRFTGQRLRDELLAARRKAEADLKATLSAIRRDYGGAPRIIRRRRRVAALTAT